MVLVGNIGKLSLVLRQAGNGLSLQTRRMTDDDNGGAFAADRRPESGVLCGTGVDFMAKAVHARKGNYEGNHL